MKTIHLVLKYQWFNMITRGFKCEEYREIKPYYDRLAALKKGDKIVFHKGYTKNKVNAEVAYCFKGLGVTLWGGDPSKLQWVIGFKLLQ